MLDQAALIKATQELEPLPPTVDQLAAIASRRNWSATEAELDVLGVHHAALGGLIAESWRLPAGIVKGIAYHHTPAEGGALVCDAVHVANVVAKQVGREEADMEADPELCEASLERLGTSTGTLLLCCHAVGERLEQVLTAYH